MRSVLIDECINPRLAVRLREVLPTDSIETVRNLGWAGQQDNVLVRQIQDRFDVFLTLDKGFEFEQNLKMLSFGVVLLETTNNQMPSYERMLEEMISAIQLVEPGQIVRVSDPRRYSHANSEV
jgi:predicted nuclease of predicted toxin-antitoxin system